MKSKTFEKKIGIASERMQELLRHAEDALLESEERRRSLFENMLDGYAYCKMLFNHDQPQGFIYIDVNPAFERLTGLKDIVGQEVSQVIPGIQDSNPELFEIYGRVALTGKPERVETYVPSLGIWFSISVFSPAKEYFAAVFENITERKKAENLLHVRMRLMEFAATHTLDQILQKTLDEVGEITGSPIGFYHLVEADQQTLSLQAWSSRTLQEFCIAQGKGSHYGITDAGVWVDCVYERRPVIHNDYGSLPHRKGMPEGHAQVIRELVVPILRGNRIVAILGVGNKPSDYTERDVELVTYLADVAWEIAERKRGEEALQESEARLNRSEEIAHLGSWELDLGKNRLTWSDEVYHIFGLQPQEFEATYDAFLERVHPDDRAAVDMAYLGSLREGKDGYEIEHRIVRRATGEIRWVHEKCQHLTDATGRVIRSLGMVLDITERNRAEEDLRKSEARYRSYIEVTGQLGWTTNADGEVVEDIPSWRKFTGQSEKEVKGWGWSKALHPDDLEHTNLVWRNAVATKETYEVEYRIRRYDGVYRHFLARGIPVLKDDRDIQEWVGTCIDITERKRTEEALKQHTVELRRLAEALEQRVQKRTEELATANETLRQLSIRLLSAQEEERKRIAGEIHDTLGGCLGGIRFKIETTLQQIGKAPNVEIQSLNAIMPAIQEGVEECRRIQMDLRPPMLDDLGLLPTFSWFFRRFHTTYSEIQIEQEIAIDEGEIPKALKIVIYRVTQEGMNNITKHSKADRVRLSLRKLDSKMEFVLHDNGRGFNQEKAHSWESTGQGLGLTTMRERVELSGGSFAIESTEGKGTTIRASWPL